MTKHVPEALAQACRDHYSPPVSFSLWLLAELAECATDLAEIIGTAIALNIKLICDALRDAVRAFLL